MTLEEVIENALDEFHGSDEITCTYPEHVAAAVRKWMEEEGYIKTPLMTCYYCHQEVEDGGIATSFKSKELVTMMHDVCKNCKAHHENRD